MKCDRKWHDGYGKLEKDDCDQCFVRDNSGFLKENPFLKPAKDPMFNWVSTGPGGCDSHCIEHPCGPCMLESRTESKKEE